MNLVYDAKVFLVGKPETLDVGFEVFCDDEGIKYVLGVDGAHGSAEELPEIAGRLCYLSFKNPRPGGNKEYLKHILESGHGSVLEHSNFGFIFTGVSRTLTHELVRHRAGFAYSQLSQRYVDESDVAFVVPPLIQRAMDYLKVLEPGQSGTTARELIANWQYSVNEAQERYKKEVNWAEQFLCQLDPSYTDRKTDLRKESRQAARSVLPNCTETKIFVTGNVRAWRHFLEQRGSRHAEVEIRRLAYKVWDVLKTEAINLFGDYVWTMDVNGQPVDVSTPYKKV